MQNNLVSIAMATYNGEKFEYMDESVREGMGYFEYVLHNEFKDRSFFSKAKDKIKITIKRLVY